MMAWRVGQAAVLILSACGHVDRPNYRWPVEAGEADHLTSLTVVGLAHERAVVPLRVSVGTPSSIVIINVHGIGPIDRELDPGEDKTWVTVEQFERALDLAAGRDDVRFTFDDGNSSDVDIALPRLVKRGIVAEFFVLAGQLDRPGRLDADGVRELLKAGMAVGSHGWDHRDWRQIDDRQADEEFVRAHQVLAEIVGEPVDTAAIPFGSYDRHVLRRLRRAKLSRVYTSDGGRARTDAWLQPRNSLHHDVDTAWMERVFNDRAPVPQRARRIAARAVKRTRGKP
jgi:peptidoglycan/xylan/chitin deacetylase (PgdA/CDA1 family)